MVIFIDLEEEAEPSDQWLTLKQNVEALRCIDIEERIRIDQLHDKRDNPNKEKAMTKALGCYPIVKEIASHIDLNSLDALSSTCRQVRVNLLQFRFQLITSTLHCENENAKYEPECSCRSYFATNVNVPIRTGASKCARDFVGPCQRCNRVVCRNCAIKPPAPSLLRNRHRRICNTCSSMELSTLIFPGNHNSRSNMPYSHQIMTKLDGNLIKLHICRCPSDRVWLCQLCAQSIRRADQEYESIWKWSSRFLPSLGGVGIGIREGNRGVPCGRGENCAKALELELEIDCDAEDARKSDIKIRNNSPDINGSNNNAVSQKRPGYDRHEIEGIGGVLKRKLVKLVKVGASVSGWGEENDAESFLVNEISGKSRSWCSWCQKVIPSGDDLEKAFIESSNQSKSFSE